MQPFWKVWLDLKKWEVSILFSEEHLKATFRTRSVLRADNHCARPCRDLSDELKVRAPQELSVPLGALHDHHHHFLPPSAEEMTQI